MVTLVRRNLGHWLVGLALTALLLGLHVQFDTYLDAARARVFDQYQVLSARPDTPSPVVMVRIDR